MNKIKTVYFDFGNVISLPQNPELRKRLAFAACSQGASEEAFWQSYFSHRSSYDKDSIGAFEYWNLISADLGIKLDKIEELIEIDDASWASINGETIAWAGDLKRSGLSIGILSNMPGAYYKKVLASSSWIGIFDHIVISGPLSLIKPDPEIFLYAISLCGSAPEEILYFDDIQKNVDAAQKLGIQAHLFTSLDRISPEVYKVLPAPVRT